MCYHFDIQWKLEQEEFSFDSDWAINDMGFFETKNGILFCIRETEYLEYASPRHHSQSKYTFDVISSARTEYYFCMWNAKKIPLLRKNGTIKS